MKYWQKPYPYWMCYIVWIAAVDALLFRTITYQGESFWETLDSKYKHEHYKRRVILELKRVNESH